MRGHLIKVLVYRRFLVDALNTHFNVSVLPMSSTKIDLSASEDTVNVNSEALPMSEPAEDSNISEVTPPPSPTRRTHRNSVDDQFDELAIRSSMRPHVQDNTFPGSVQLGLLLDLVTKPSLSILRTIEQSIDRADVDKVSSIIVQV